MQTRSSQAVCDFCQNNQQHFSFPNSFLLPRSSRSSGCAERGVNSPRLGCPCPIPGSAPSQPGGAPTPDKPCRPHSHPQVCLQRQEPHLQRSGTNASITQPLAPPQGKLPARFSAKGRTSPGCLGVITAGQRTRLQGWKPVQQDR